MCIKQMLHVDIKEKGKREEEGGGIAGPHARTYSDGNQAICAANWKLGKASLTRIALPHDVYLQFNFRNFRNVGQRLEIFMFCPADEERQEDADKCAIDEEESRDVTFASPLTLPSSRLLRPARRILSRKADVCGACRHSCQDARRGYDGGDHHDDDEEDDHLDSVAARSAM